MRVRVRDIFLRGETPVDSFTLAHLLVAWILVLYHRQPRVDLLEGLYLVWKIIGMVNTLPELETWLGFIII